DGVAAARQGSAGDDIERDPQAERIAVRERGRRSEADCEAPDDQDDAGCREREKDLAGAGEERAAERLCVRLHQLSLFRLRNMTAPNSAYRATGPMNPL